MGLGYYAFISFSLFCPGYFFVSNFFILLFNFLHFYLIFLMEEEEGKKLYLARPWKLQSLGFEAWRQHIL